MKSDNKDRIGEEIVKRTEIWPKGIAIPEEIGIQELLYSNPGKHELGLTYFTRYDTDRLRPAVLFIHGGSWKGGGKTQFYRQALYLTRKYNIFSVCIGYRLSNVAHYPAALIDCKCAVRWIRSVAGKQKIDIPPENAASPESKRRCVKTAEKTQGRRDRKPRQTIRI